MAHTLVTFHAHPDDEALLTSGVMARAAAEGHRVVLVVATRGEVGDVASDVLGDHETLAERRVAEQRRSAEILGVHRLEFLGFADSGLDGTGASYGDRGAPGLGAFALADIDRAAARLAAILNEEDADVLTIYDPNGGYRHPDHIHVHRVGQRAGELAGTPIVLEATINRELMRMGVELAGDLGYELPAEFTPESFDDWYLPAEQLTHAVDVSAYLDQKRASMAAHASQATGDGEPRSLARFLAIPDEYFGLAFGTEWFVDRRQPPGAGLDDVFASPVSSDAGDRGRTG
jgi:LmbE family N-acetylglucosaminyl deacetylase